MRSVWSSEWRDGLARRGMEVTCEEILHRSRPRAGSDIKSGWGSDKGLGRIVVDGEPGPQFEGEKATSFVQSFGSGATSLVRGYFGDLIHWTHGVSAPVFSADGSHVAYVAHRGKDDEVVMADGQPGLKFRAIVAGARFCPKGLRLAYAARREKNDEVVVVDDEPGPKFGAIVAGPRFCGEGRHVAYAVSDAGGKYLVVDGEHVGEALLEGADIVSEPAFAPNGRRVGYVAAKGSIWARAARNMATGIDSTAPELGRSAKRRVYVDGEAGKEYDARDLASGVGD